MNTSLNQMLNVSIDSRKDGTLQIQFQSSLLKVICSVCLFLAISNINLKFAIALLTLALVLRGVIFIKDLLSMDFNFTLDNDDLKEINEQMWN